VGKKLNHSIQKIGEKPRSMSLQLIINEAKKRKINATIIYPNLLIKLQHKKHIEYVFEQMTTKTSIIGLKCCQDKILTKFLLDKNNISISHGKEFKINQFNNAEKFVKKIGWPIVLKPNFSTHGSDVYININNDELFKKYWKKILERHETIIIEKYFEGKEYRILATKNQTVGIIHRVPANIVGDGINSIKKLIERKNSDSKRGDSYDKSLISIKIDEDLLFNLKKQNLNLNSILEKNQKVFLKDVSNLSQGGDSIDFTDIAHPSIKKIAVKTIQSIPGLAYGGIDFLTKDITKKQDKNSYIIVEVNASPMISMHHVPYEGKPRDIAKIIIDILFSETISKIKRK